MSTVQYQTADMGATRREGRGHGPRLDVDGLEENVAPRIVYRKPEARQSRLSKEHTQVKIGHTCTSRSHAEGAME